MDKQQLLDELKIKVAAGELSKSEVDAALNAEPVVSATPVDSNFHPHLSLQEIIYYIGGAIVFIGLAVMISQNWDAFNSTVRILITLGSALAAYTMGFLFSRREETHKVAQPFFMLSALLLPAGIAVTLYESNSAMNGNIAAVIVSGLSLLVFGVSFSYFKSNLQLFFVSLFSTWLFFAVTGMLAEGAEYYVDQDFFLYRMMVVGVSYLLLGYYTQNNRFNPMSGLYYFFGSFVFLLSGIILGGWTPDQNIFWELVYPFLSLGLVFGSTQVKSRSLLLWGTVFFMAYLIKISAEYFADSLGWPLALIICGLAMIAVGYYAFRIKKEYIT